MTRTRWVGLGPGLLVGTGIIASTFIAALTADSGWWVLLGPLLLALAIVAADLLDSRLRGTLSGPSGSALMMGGAMLLAGVIVAFRDPDLVRTLIPAVAAPAWVTLVLRPGMRRRTCSGI